MMSADHGEALRAEIAELGKEIAEKEKLAKRLRRLEDYSGAEDLEEELGDLYEELERLKTQYENLQGCSGPAIFDRLLSGRDVVTACRNGSSPGFEPPTTGLSDAVKLVCGCALVRVVGAGRTRDRAEVAQGGQEER
jgi:hypothetical protein